MTATVRLNDRLQSHRAIVWCAALALLMAFGRVGMGQETAPDETPPAAQISRLIRQLNSQRFAEREEAVHGLAKFGSVAVRPLAKNYQEASPETMWRTLEVLRRIGVEGDEATFYRVAALIKLLAGELDVTGRLTAIHQHWTARQTARAAERLQSQGAVVHLADPAAQVQVQEHLLWVIQDLNDVVPEEAAASRRGRTAVETGLAGASSAPPMAKRIDQILVASVEQNREFAFGPNPELASAAEAWTNGQVNRRLLDAVPGNVIAFPDGRLGWADNGSHGTRVEFSQAWKGNLVDFAVLQQIKDLTSVSFKSFPIQRSHLEVLSRVSTLQSLSWVSCEVDAQAWSELGRLASVQQCSFDSVKLDEEAIRGLAALPQLQMLKLTSTPFTQRAMQPLSDAPVLQTLILENVQLTTEHLEALAALRGLRQLQWTQCRFPFNDYRRLFANRTDLYLQVSGNAFLGIRGAGNVGGTFVGACQVSEVVPDTAADRAGLRVGDAILQIDDKGLESFQDLMAAISQYQPGDQIKMTIRRGSTNMDLEATLGARNEPLR